MSSTATSSPNAATLLAPIAEDMQQVNRVIRQRLASEVMLINQISEYIIGAGGKRLRPALLLLVAGALGDTTGHRHELAAVVEFIHTATLLHDDVVDESDLRRGRKTANALFGNAASVLVGDFLYSRSFQMMVGVGKMRVMEILSVATNVIAEGEVLQLLNMHDPDVDEARYLQVIRYKTAKLFEAAAQLGAVLSGADAEDGSGAPPSSAVASAPRSRSSTTGSTTRARAESMGKNAGDDLREGKPTLPLIYADGARHGGTGGARARSDRARRHGSLRRRSSRRSPRSGALDSHARMRARAKRQAAANAIVVVPDSIYKESLLELCSYSTARQS